MSAAASVITLKVEPVWRPSGANGLADSEGIIGSTWPQGGNALSMLVGPERLAHFLAAPEPVRRAEVLATLVRLYGDAAGEPDALLERHWGVDPFTQGYITQWAPGDVCAVGPLHEGDALLKRQAADGRFAVAAVHGGGGHRLRRQRVQRPSTIRRSPTLHR